MGIVPTPFDGDAVSVRRHRRALRRPRWIAVFCLLAQNVLLQNVWAQTNLVEHDVKAAAGSDVRVGVYTSIRPDCTSGPLPAIRLATPPAHGEVIVKRAMLKATNVKQCLAIDVPAFVAFYRAAANYSGGDAFELEIAASGGRKQVQHFNVSISSDRSGGQGI